MGYPVGLDSYTRGETRLTFQSARTLLYGQDRSWNEFGNFHSDQDFMVLDNDVEDMVMCSMV